MATNADHGELRKETENRKTYFRGAELVLLLKILLPIDFPIGDQNVY